uniref:non-specific serine/threonine protein kinase n=1 Tax=Aegilops tauschii subsp. strangulata TaxID=200361 RepID=A0A453KQG7_AEGTS
MCSCCCESMKIVAIKKMDLPTAKQADGEREFRVEIDILSRLDHPNLVTLIGYCADGKHRFVVYEFMPKGNLQDVLNGIHGEVRMGWGQRLRIALGAARGLTYLHSTTAVGVPVVHRDFKSSNILLSDHFEAKISDFGLAKLMPQDLDLYATTRVLGTFGYFDPEYALVMATTLHHFCRTRRADRVPGCTNEDSSISHADGEADAAERRVRVRRRPPGAAHRPPRHRSQPGASGPEPHCQDTPDGGGPEEAAQGGGPGHGQGVVHAGVGVHVRRPRRALRLLRERRPAGHAGLRQGAPAHHVRQHEDMSTF